MSVQPRLQRHNQSRSLIGHKVCLDTSRAVVLLNEISRVSPRCRVPELPRSAGVHKLRGGGGEPRDVQVENTRRQDVWGSGVRVARDKTSARVARPVSGAS